MSGRTARRLLIWPMLALIVAHIPGQAGAQSAPVERADGATEPNPNPVQPAPQQTEPPPWHRGVSDDDRRAATELFEQAVALHDELLRARAIAAYERALERWDHPNIRFNLARALHDVGQHLRAWEQLQQALRWGMASFSPADQARLGALRDELLGSRLAVLAIRCDEPDVSLKMDGQPLFICPGQERRVVRPGEHVVAATKPGYQPAARVVTALSGSQRAASATRPGPVAIKLYRESRLSRWPKGLPWAAVGAGVALGAVGVWYTSRVNDGSGRLAEAVTPCGDAEDLGDCDLSYYEAQNPDVSPGRIRRDRNLAIAAFTAAGALTTAGLVAVFLNRSQLTRRTQRGRIEITPLVSPDHAGLGVGGSL